MRCKTLIALALLLPTALAVRAEGGAEAFGRGDFAAAAARFEAGAAAGDATAQNNLGVLYLRGKGVAQDYERARELFEAAARQHLPGAMFNLGMMHLRGYGMQAQPGVAADWFARAAALDDREAQFFLGVLLTRGDGVPADPTRAKALFLAAALARLPAAQFNLAMLYLDEPKPGEDEAAALQWLEAAAKQDYARAKLHIAKLDLRHNDEPGRLEHAATLLRELADAGEPEAQMEFGLLNLFGGLPKNEDEGRFWLRQAALQGLADAQVNLGAVYARGLGITPDPAEAYAWLTLAAEQDPKARPALDAVAGKLSPSERSDADARLTDLRVKVAEASTVTGTE